MGQAFFRLPGLALPVREELTPEGLTRVNRAEEFLMAKGFRQLRVRAHGEVARIELVPEDIPRFLEEGLREETAAFSGASALPTPRSTCSATARAASMRHLLRSHEICAPRGDDVL